MIFKWDFMRFTNEPVGICDEYSVHRIYRHCAYIHIFGVDIYVRYTWHFPVVSHH